MLSFPPHAESAETKDRLLAGQLFLTQAKEGGLHEKCRLVAYKLCRDLLLLRAREPSSERPPFVLVLLY